MPRSRYGTPALESQSAAVEPVCGRLKAMFDRLTDEPLPDRLIQLADQLEDAFQSGRLFDRVADKPRRR